MLEIFYSKEVVALLSNKQIYELEGKIVQAQSDEEVFGIFADAGIHVSKEQLQSLADDAEKELTEDALDMDSGGGKRWQVVRSLYNRYRASCGKGYGGGFSKGSGSFGGDGGSGGGRF